MIKKPVIAIFDIGKTNKKLFLFDQDYQVVFELSTYLAEIKDEDGDQCENLEGLKKFIFDSLQEVLQLNEYDIKVLNFSTYGASLVHLDKNFQPITPLYNYLKPYPDSLKDQFYNSYGGEEEISLSTASPVLGSLNSGLQLYRIKYQNPAVFDKIKWTLHLPQYLSSLISGRYVSDITSIGCHTHLWDFKKNDYHDWVRQEGFYKILPPIEKSDKALTSLIPNTNFKVGIGLHDSSAALIPYLLNFKEPFILISTGTWCISLNPFNSLPLTSAELKQNCLSYLSYKGIPIKASRLFAGYEHEHQVEKIASFFNQHKNRYKTISFDKEIIAKLKHQHQSFYKENEVPDLFKESPFTARDLSEFSSYEEAYHQLILDLIFQQQASTNLIMGDINVKQIYVDGGFSKNDIFMHALAMSFPDKEIFAASMAQATALGTALAVHSSWNEKPIPSNLFNIHSFSSG